MQGVVVYLRFALDAADAADASIHGKKCIHLQSPAVFVKQTVGYVTICSRC
jgi:hypothetical protein